MTEQKKTTTMKSGNKKHSFTLTKTTIGGHVFISLKKNDGNPIIKLLSSKRNKRGYLSRYCRFNREKIFRRNRRGKIK